MKMWVFALLLRIHLKKDTMVFILQEDIISVTWYTICVEITIIYKLVITSGLNKSLKQWLLVK